MCKGKFAGLTGSLLGSTRDEVRGRFGEPDQMGGMSRKYRTPRIWRYGPVEFHFNPGGRLWLIYAEDGDGNPELVVKEAEPPRV